MTGHPTSPEQASSEIGAHRTASAISDVLY